MSTRHPVRADVHATGTIPDLAKWVGAFAILGGGIAGFYYWSDESLLLRVIGLLVLGAVALFVAVQTHKGRAAWDFVRESHTEVRKVVWPTRKETTQTTLIVIAMVGLVAIIMWILDGLLAWLVKLLLGTGT
jgi:preprotein translocase subunit SecE